VPERRRRVEAVALPVDGALPPARARLAARPRAARRLLLLVPALLIAIGVVYLVARETSAFAVRAIDVEGAAPGLAARVHEALAPLEGRSLVSLDRRDVARRVLALPEIAGASVDRAFPHTLRVNVRVERPAAVLRLADDAWLASADGRVLRRLQVRPYPPLPRIWLPRAAVPAVGSTVPGDASAALAAAGALVGTPFRDAVTTIRGHGELTLVLRSGLQLRLGDLQNVRLKLAVAARIVPLATGARYVDVAVPDRAVAAFNTQPQG